MAMFNAAHKILMFCDLQMKIIAASATVEHTWDLIFLPSSSSPPPLQNSIKIKNSYSFSG